MRGAKKKGSIQEFLDYYYGLLLYMFRHRVHFVARVVELLLLVLSVVAYGWIARLAMFVGAVLLVLGREECSVVFLITYAANDDGWLLPVLELLFLSKQLSRWPLLPVDRFEPLRVFDESTGIVYEQISSSTLAEVGRFWSGQYPWTEPCGAALFREFNTDSHRAAIESELADGFPHFFATSRRLGWFARCAKTQEIVGYRLANDAAYSKWSLEERFLRALTRFYVANSAHPVAKLVSHRRKWKVSLMTFSLYQARKAFSFLIPRAYWIFLATPILCWSQEEKYEKAIKEIDWSYDVFQANTTLNLFGFGVRGDWQGKGIAGRMTVRQNQKPFFSCGFASPKITFSDALLATCRLAGIQIRSRCPREGKIGFFLWCS